MIVVNCLVAGLLCCEASTAQAGLFGWFSDSRLSRLPEPVRQTVVSNLGSGRLTDLWLTNENGHAVYEVEMRQRGVDRSFTVGLDGGLLARQVFTNELPPAVLQTVNRETRGDKEPEIYWSNEQGDPVYYVEFQKGPAHSNLSVGLDGWVTSRQISLKEAPEPVQAAIREKLGGRSTLAIDRADDGEEVTYEVVDRTEAVERVWIFYPDGSVAAEPIALGAIPDSARTVLNRQSAGARILHLLKIPHQGGILYDMSFVRREARHVCTVEANGQIVSEEQPLKELPEVLQQAIKAKSAGRFIVRIEKSPSAKGATFDVLLRNAGKTEVIKLEYPP